MSGRDHLQPVADPPEETPGTDLEVVNPDLAFSDLPSAMWAFPNGLPDEYEQLHSAVVDSLRRDARHLPVHSVAAMQIERLAGLYIKIRWHEALNNWPNVRYHEWIYKEWRSLANDVASSGYSNKISPEELHQIVSAHTAKIVASVLQHLPREESRVLYKKFAAALEEKPA